VKCWVTLAASYRSFCCVAFERENNTKERHKRLCSPTPPKKNNEKRKRGDDARQEKDCPVSTNLS